MVAALGPVVDIAGGARVSSTAAAVTMVVDLVQWQGAQVGERRFGKDKRLPALLVLLRLLHLLRLAHRQHEAGRSADHHLVHFLDFSMWGSALNSGPSRQLPRINAERTRLSCLPATFLSEQKQLINNFLISSSHPPKNEQSQSSHITRSHGIR